MGTVELSAGTVGLSAGTVEVQDTGGDGPVVVLIGGLAIGPSLWRGVVDDLRADHRCIVPTLPWGAHRIPMRPGADLTLRGHARSSPSCSRPSTSATSSSSRTTRAWPSSWPPTTPSDSPGSC